MPFDKFFNCFNCAEDGIIKQSFKINNFFGKDKRKKQIWIKKKYALFTDIIRRTEIKRIVYLRLANLDEKNKDKKEEKTF